MANEDPSTGSAGPSSGNDGGGSFSDALKAVDWLFTESGQKADRACLTYTRKPESWEPVVTNSTDTTFDHLSETEMSRLCEYTRLTNYVKRDKAEAAAVAACEKMVLKRLYGDHSTMNTLFRSSIDRSKQMIRDAKTKGRLSIGRSGNESHGWYTQL